MLFNEEEMEDFIDVPVIEVKRIVNVLAKCYCHVLIEVSSYIRIAYSMVIWCVV